MWKDFFYYSKSERRAVLVLMALIVLLLVVLICLPDPTLKSQGNPQPDTTMVSIRKSMEQHPSKQENQSYTLAAFEPNLADSIELSALGLPPYVVRNILKYRLKGGRFDSPEDLSRIYGLTAEKFAELKPYIRISEKFKRSSKPVVSPSRPKAAPKERKHFPKDSMKVYKYPEGTLVDVATADTTELKKIPGIGSVISRAIVRYRERLGGFVRLEQLEEVKYVTPELMEWFTLSAAPVRKISMNSANLDELRAHPYLNFYQAKVILEHRRKQGKLKSLSQLSLYEEFTEKDLERLADYVSFD